jgi:hypothetical protein
VLLVPALDRDGAHRVLLTGLARMLRAAGSPDCARLLGPIVPGATLPGGARVPGTSYELDPVQAAWNLALLLHWEEPEAPPGPADALAAALAVADWSARRALMQGLRPTTVGELLARVMAAESPETAPTSRSTPEPADRRHTRVIRRADAIAEAVRRALRAGTLEAGVEDRSATQAIPVPAPVREADAALAVLPDELTAAVMARLPAKRASALLALAADRGRLEATPVDAFVALLVTN